jgi:hypothetical protein
MQANHDQLLLKNRSALAGRQHRGPDRRLATAKPADGHYSLRRDTQPHMQSFPGGRRRGVRSTGGIQDARVVQ